MSTQSPTSKLTASQVKLIEAEGDVLKQLQLLESNTCYQAIGVFALHGEWRTVGKLRQEHARQIGSRGHIKEFSANKEGKVVAVDRLLAQTQGRANTANMGRSTAAKAKVDRSCSVIVFEGKKHGHQVAVLDRKDVLMEGACWHRAD